MIVISSTDFQKLSAGSQRELLDLLSFNASGQQPREDEMSLPFEDFDSAYNESPWAPQPDLNPETDLFESGISSVLSLAPQQEDVDPVRKKVVEISVDQARDLIANVSDKSKDALKLFVSGQPVSLAALVGPSAPYRDHNELKRSFVGAVNRRLRTVTENRTAVLFSSDRDKTRIRITPLSATALRQALDVPEPLPNFDFYDQAGQQVPVDGEPIGLFMQLLESAWQDLSMRPTEGRIALVPSQVVSHFLNHGFILVAGKPMATQDDNQTVWYEYTADNQDQTALCRQIDLDGGLKMSDETGAFWLRIFLKHPSMPELFAAVHR